MPDQKISAAHGRQLVYFSAERTLPSWIRAALSLMVLGFVLDRFGLFLRQIQPVSGKEVLPEAVSLWSGATMVIIGSFMALMASCRLKQCLWF